MGSLTIFSGAFGSGKSEISINYAMKLAEHREQVFLTDMDMASPYFVSRDAFAADGESCENIRLIAPDRGLAMGDVPNLPAEIIGFIREDNDMVIDLAGDEAGALVLGYVSKFIKARKNVNLYMVLNPFRPFSSTVSDVKELRDMLERAANIQFNGIVSNPNLVEESSVKLIIEGHKKVEEFAHELDLPIKYLTVEEKYYREIYHEYGSIVSKIRLFLRPDWIQDT